MANSPPDPIVCAFDLKTLVETRRRVHALAAAAGLSGNRLYKFVVAVNELMTNAVRPGGGRGEVRLWLEGEELRCEVSDEGTGIPGGHVNGHNRPQPGTLGGWGLWLARQIADGVDIDTGSGGTKVRLRYLIDTPPG